MKPSPLPTLRVCVAVVVLAGAGLAGWWSLTTWRTHAASATRRWRERVAERARLEATAGGATWAEQKTERARLEGLWGQACRGWACPVPAAAEPESTAVFFSLNAQAEQLQAQARAAGLVLPEHERFGFSAYAQAGPAVGELAQVQQQQQAMAQLAAALFAVKPHAVLAWQRGKPVESTPAPARRVAPAGEPDELFTLEPRLSLRVPGVVETQAVRVVFVGRTATLQALLNRLVRTAPALVVRAVEVVPLAGPIPSGVTELAARVPEPASVVLRAGGPPAEAQPARADTPFLVPDWSRFTVTVERVVWTGRAGSADPAPPPPVPDPWPVAPAGNAGKYALFTPPTVWRSVADGGLTVTAPGDPDRLPGGRLSWLQLRTVQPELFRLQLVGFVAEPAGPGWGVFQNGETGETRLLRGVQTLPELELTLLRIAVERRPCAASAALPEWGATAWVRDERTGQVVELTDRTRHYTGAALATVELEGVPRQVRTGTLLQRGATSCRIGNISLQPPTVTVVADAPGWPESLTQTLTLTPGMPPGAPTAFTP